MLTPIVKWAQNDDVIDITLLLTDVCDPVVEISQGALSFTGIFLSCVRINRIFPGKKGLILLKV